MLRRSCVVIWPVESPAKSPMLMVVLTPQHLAQLSHDYISLPIKQTERVEKVTYFRLQKKASW